MIKVLYEDKYLIVCEKPVNILSEEQANTKRTMPDIIKRMTGAYKIDTIHRLDKMVGGVMVYSKSRSATKGLSAMVRNRKITKEYLAVVHGEFDVLRGEMRDYLFKDSKNNKSYVVKTLRKGAKDALLEYEVLAHADIPEKGKVSLVRIKLHTGRTHQIRVQFSSRKHPLVGDGKYGSRDNDCFLALWAFHLEFSHPNTRKTVSNYSFPNTKDYPWRVFENKISELKGVEKNDL